MYKLAFFVTLGLLLVLMSGAVWAKEIKVPTDFPTIAQALNNASNGDVIKVAEGAFTENVTITATFTLTENLMLEGAGAEKTTIDGINGQSQNQPTLTIQNINNVTVRGFTIKNGGRRGVQIERATGVVIENNIIRLNRRVGISVQNQSQVKILNNQISEVGNDGDVRGRGVQIVDSQAHIQGNTFPCGRSRHDDL
jgi:parallel beta-helix repeat protein